MSLRREERIVDCLAGSSNNGAGAKTPPTIDCRNDIALGRRPCERASRRKVKKLNLLEFTGGSRMSAQFTKVCLNRM
jgi:hypothetical protein